MRDAEKQAIFGAAESYGLPADEFFEVIEEICELRVRMIVSAIAGCVDDKTWDKVQTAIDRARSL